MKLQFLILRIVGDTCNLAGAVLTDQQPLQKVIGIYYILQVCCSKALKVFPRTFPSTQKWL